MLELLQSRARITGPELGRRLEVGERTIRRYAVMLQEMGVPVEGERGRYGAYRLGPGYRLPPMMFTDDEALGLALSLMAARRLGLSGAAPAVEGALAKLERVMPETLGRRVRALEGTISLAAPESRVNTEALILLSTSVEERTRVRIHYRVGERETDRAVDPYGILNREGYWYFIGYCHLRGGLRLFRLDRVQTAEQTGEKFVRPREFDSEEALLDAVASGDRDRYSVEVLLMSKDVRWQLPSLWFSLDEVEEGTVIRCTTFDLDWVARILAGLNCEFRITSPPELRDELVTIAENLMKFAGKDTA